MLKWGPSKRTSSTIQGPYILGLLRVRVGFDSVTLDLNRELYISGIVFIPGLYPIMYLSMSVHISKTDSINCKQIGIRYLILVRVLSLSLSHSSLQVAL